MLSARGRQPLLDGALHRARGAYGSAGECRIAVVAGPVAGNGRGAMAVFAGGAERSGGGRAGGPDKTGKHLGIQPEERIIHRFQHLKRPGKSAPRSRTIEHADVGAVEPFVPGCDGHAARG